MAREFTTYDLLEFRFIADPQLSPSGREVAYTIHRVLPDDDGYAADIYVHDLDEGKCRRFTSGDSRDVNPRYSPDGQWLAFVSNREVDGEKVGRQLWVMPTGGGEAFPLTRVDGGVGSFAFSPAGDRIVLVGRAGTEGLTEICDDDGDEDKDELQELYDKYTDGVRHITGIKYKFDGQGFLDDKRSHVGIIEFDANPGSGTPNLCPVTDGDYDHRSPRFSPCGQWLAVSAVREADPDLQKYSDIWVFPASGEGEPVKITRSLGPASSPSWSPDGTTIAYLGHKREIDGGYNNMRLWLADVGNLSERPEEFELTDLTVDSDVSFGDSSITDTRFGGGTMPLTFNAEGTRVYYVTSERGTTHLVQVDVRTGESGLLTGGDRVIYDADVRPDLGLAAAAVATPGDPGTLNLVSLEEPILGAGAYSDEVLEVDAGESRERVLAAPNEEFLAERNVRCARRFKARSSEGAPELDCWIITPEDTEAPLPSILQIHGGPTAMYTGTFFFEFQMLAANGYAVIFTNPRGSSGYGEDFRAAIAPGWGNLDYADVMACVDRALELHGELDVDRLGVAGGSYGGYMTNWIIGHTDRFSAAVTMRCVSNLYSFWGTSDIGFLWDERYGGHPWEVPENYRQQSPITYLGDVTTPTLVIHSEEDHRCPMEQGEQVFATLKKQGVETEFLRYPGESHGLSRGGRPWHRIHRLEQIIQWFDRYI